MEEEFDMAAFLVSGQSASVRSNSNIESDSSDKESSLASSTGSKMLNHEEFDDPEYEIIGKATKKTLIQGLYTKQKRQSDQQLTLEMFYDVLDSKLDELIDVEGNSYDPSIVVRDEQNLSLHVEIRDCMQIVVKVLTSEQAAKENRVNNARTELGAALARERAAKDAELREAEQRLQRLRNQRRVLATGEFLSYKAEMFRDWFYKRPHREEYRYGRFEWAGLHPKERLFVTSWSLAAIMLFVIILAIGSMGVDGVLEAQEVPLDVTAASVQAVADSAHSAVVARHQHIARHSAVSIAAMLDRHSAQLRGTNLRSHLQKRAEDHVAQIQILAQFAETREREILRDFLQSIIFAEDYIHTLQVEALFMQFTANFTGKVASLTNNDTKMTAFSSINGSTAPIGGSLEPCSVTDVQQEAAIAAQEVRCARVSGNSGSVWLRCLARFRQDSNIITAGDHTFACIAVSTSEQSIRRRLVDDVVSRYLSRSRMNVVQEFSEQAAILEAMTSIQAIVRSDAAPQEHIVRLAGSSQIDATDDLRQILSRSPRVHSTNGSFVRSFGIPKNRQTTGVASFNVTGYAVGSLQGNSLRIAVAASINDEAYLLDVIRPGSQQLLDSMKVVMTDPNRNATNTSALPSIRVHLSCRSAQHPDRVYATFTNSTGHPILVDNATLGQPVDLRYFPAFGSAARGRTGVALMPSMQDGRMAVVGYSYAKHALAGVVVEHTGESIDNDVRKVVCTAVNQLQTESDAVAAKIWIVRRLARGQVAFYCPSELVAHAPATADDQKLLRAALQWTSKSGNQSKVRWIDYDEEQEWMGYATRISSIDAVVVVVSPIIPPAAIDSIYGWSAFVAIGIFFLLAAIQRFYVRLALDRVESEYADYKTSIFDEKARFIQLVDDMVPGYLRKRTESGERLIFEHHTMLTFIFADMFGTGEIFATLSTTEFVRVLGYLFMMEDGVANYYKIFKVKTIGDGYFGVSGLPEREATGLEETTNSIQVYNAFSFAVVMQQLLSGRYLHFPERTKCFAQFSKRENLPPLPIIELKIGIHTGKAHTGILHVGRAPKFDCYGKAVSLASRMEQTAARGRIQTTTATRHMLEELDVEKMFRFEKSQKKLVKGMGAISTHSIKETKLSVPESILQWLKVDHVLANVSHEKAGGSSRVQRFGDIESNVAPSEAGDSTSSGSVLSMFARPHPTNQSSEAATPQQEDHKASRRKSRADRGDTSVAVNPSQAPNMSSIARHPFDEDYDLGLEAPPPVPSAFEVN